MPKMNTTLLYKIVIYISLKNNSKNGHTSKTGYITCSSFLLLAVALVR